MAIGNETFCFEIAKRIAVGKCAFTSRALCEKHAALIDVSEETLLPNEIDRSVLVACSWGKK